MGVHMCWEWQPDGMAAGDFDTIDAAAEALASSAHRTYHRYDQLAQRHRMIECAGQLQEQMRTEGAASIAAGESWTGRCGGVTVTLSPR